MNGILRLHTDSDGIVWCGQNGVCAVNSRLTPEEFVSRNSFSSAKLVRILGLPVNANLIVRAYESQKSKPAAQLPVHSVLGKAARALEVGSAAVCPTAVTRRDPTEVLQRMWQSDTSGRLSACWRRVDSDMFNSYLLRISLEESEEKAISIFRYHPLACPLGFLNSFSLKACVYWASEVLDPRWFSHPDKPHRFTKLMRFLGLYPDNFKLFFTENGLKKHRSLGNQVRLQRARVTYACWNTLVADEVDYTSPHNFLWRINKYHGFGWKGALASSRAFVRYAVLHWQDKLNPLSRVFFDPDLYFGSSEEVEAYSLYTNTGQVRG